MPVPSSHLFCLMAHELVDQPLIDLSCGQVRREAVPVAVKTYLELATGSVETPTRPQQRLIEAAVS
jgi:hypothetical protein